MVSASSDPVDVVVGLEIGADDYIIKPFEVRELAARINAKLRRQRTTQSQVRPGRLKFPGLIVDVGRHEVLRDGKPVTLTPTEFDLLALLSASPGRVISRSEMIQKVWGQGADLDLRSVDAHVYRLRRKIEPEGPRPTYIHAVPGIGYRFERRGLNERLAKAQESTPEPNGVQPGAGQHRPSSPTAACRRSERATDGAHPHVGGGGRPLGQPTVWRHGGGPAPRPAEPDRRSGAARRAQPRPLWWRRGARRRWPSGCWSTHWPRSLSSAGRASTSWLVSSESVLPWGSAKSRQGMMSPLQTRRSLWPP